jgi:hypothetical protein
MLLWPLACLPVTLSMAKFFLVETKDKSGRILKLIKPMMSINQLRNDQFMDGIFV